MLYLEIEWDMFNQEDGRGTTCIILQPLIVGSHTSPSHSFIFVDLLFIFNFFEWELRYNNFIYYFNFVYMMYHIMLNNKTALNKDAKVNVYWITSYTTFTHYTNTNSAVAVMHLYNVSWGLFFVFVFVLLLLSSSI